MKLFVLLFAMCVGFVGICRADSFVNGQEADLVIGQPDFTSSVSRTTQAGLRFADAVAVDLSTGKLFICDTGNSRVLRYASVDALANGAPAEAVFGQPGFDHGMFNTHEAGMNYPGGICLDESGHLWVADSWNNRVLRFDNASWKASHSAADGVLGQINFWESGQSSLSTGMRAPTGMAVSRSGTLWVADQNNNRVLRFDNAAGKANGASADGVLGQPGYGVSTAATTRAGMNRPRGVGIDASGRLWVADQSNHRVLRFDGAAGKADGDPADGVLGQGDFISHEASWIKGVNAANMAIPDAVVVDASGTLFVSDTSNDRVLVFKAAAAKGDGASAEIVLGQPSLTKYTYGTFTTGATSRSLLIQSTSGLALDSVGRLYVAQSGASRVTRFSPLSGTPKLVVRGSLRRTVRRNWVFLYGWASSALGLSSIKYRVGVHGLKRAWEDGPHWRIAAPVAPGMNKIVIFATALDGSRSAVSVSIFRR